MTGLLGSLLLLAGGCPVEAPSPAPPLPPRGVEKPAVAKDAKKPSPTPWPALPLTQEVADALVKTLTVTPPPANPAAELDARQLRALLLRRVKQGRAKAGWPAIKGWFQEELDRAAAAKRGAQILWGVYHDSGGQVRAFRRLVGQSGLRGLHAVALEQLSADGHWTGASGPAQQGDSADLARYLASGDRAAWLRLRQRQHKYNHTAWKFGYLPEVMDLLTSARAGGQRLLPCDMPAAIKRRLIKLPMKTRLRLRELHCGLALTRALHLAGVAAPRRLATLWGQEHVMPAGVPRFLPAGTRVMSVLVFGHRPGPHGLEQRLRGKLMLTHPLLLPVDEQASRLVLLLPGPALGIRLERSRQNLDQPLVAARRGVVTARSPVGGQLLVGGRVHRVPGTGDRFAPPRVRLSVGSHAFLHTIKGGRQIAGALQIPAEARADLDLDPLRREVQITVFAHIPPRSGPEK